MVSRRWLKITPWPEMGKSPGSRPVLKGRPSLVEGFFMRRGSLGRWFDGRPNAGATPARRTIKTAKLRGSSLADRSTRGTEGPTLFYKKFGTKLAVALRKRAPAGPSPKKLGELCSQNTKRPGERRRSGWLRKPERRKVPS